MILGKIKVVSRVWWLVFLFGALFGALIMLAIRFATYSPERVHYHANFAVYLNGRQEQFKSPRYYQEVAVCSLNKVLSPEQRAHMHDNINSVIHVHDHAVTWGQFFANLGWTLGPDLLETNDGTQYAANDTDKLNIILNGQDYTDIGSLANRVIDDRDRLLVSFGDIDASSLRQEYDKVPSTAAKYDADKDPATCSGSEKPTISDRLHHIL